MKGKIKIKIFMMVVIFLGLCGCATTNPGLKQATVHPEHIFDAPKHITLGLYTNGLKKDFVVKGTAGILGLEQYNIQLRGGTFTLSIPQETVHAYAMFKKALNTGIALAFDRVIPVKSQVSLPMEAEYILSVELTGAHGKQKKFYGYCSIQYHVQLLDRTGHVIASTSSKTISDSYGVEEPQLFIEVQEACGTASRKAALEVINWAYGLINDRA